MRAELQQLIAMRATLETQQRRAESAQNRGEVEGIRQRLNDMEVRSDALQHQIKSSFGNSALICSPPRLAARNRESSGGPLLEDLAHPAREAGDRVAHVDHVTAIAKRDRLRSRSMDDDGLVIGVNQDDKPHAAAQVLGDLLANRSGSIFGRQHLEDRVWCHRREPSPSRWRWRHSIATNEGDIRSAHRVGIPREREPRLDNRDTFWPILQVKLQEVTQLQHDPAVLDVDRTHGNEPAFDELVPLARRHSLELFHGNETLSPWHLLEALHGILASS